MAGAPRRRGCARLPDVVILGAQRGGTTSLFDWLAMHRSVAPSTTKEVHYFDRFYANGERWYRAHFPLKGGSRLAMEATPYLLFYPPRPAAGGRRTSRPRRGSSCCCAIPCSAPSRSTGTRVGCRPRTNRCRWRSPSRTSAWPGRTRSCSAGGESFAHRNFSYKARGHYAEQLRRWFAVIDRDRILVMESEELCERAVGARPCPGLAGVGGPRRALSFQQRCAPGPTRGASRRRGAAPALRPLQRGPVRICWARGCGSTEAPVTSTGGPGPPPTWPRRARRAPSTARGPGRPGARASRARPRRRPLGPAAASSSGVRRGW